MTMRNDETNTFRPSSDQQGHPGGPPGGRAGEDRLRMLQNVTALVFVVVLVGLGSWLIDRLSAYSRNMSCLSSHHRNCGE